MQLDPTSLISAFFLQVANLDQYSLSAQEVEALTSAQAILSASPEIKKQALLAIPAALKVEQQKRKTNADKAAAIKADLDRGLYPDRSIAIAQLLTLNTGAKPGSFCLFDALAKLRSKLSQSRHDFTPDQLTSLVHDIAHPISQGHQLTNEHVLLRPVILAAESAPLPDPVKAQLQRLAHAIQSNIDKSIQRPKDAKPVLHILDSLIGIPKPPDTLPLNPGDGWSDLAIAHLHSLPPQSLARWQSLFDHAKSLKTARPSGAWRKRALALIHDIGIQPFSSAIIQWLSAVDLKRTQPLALHLPPQGEWSRDITLAHAPPDQAAKFLDPDNALLLKGLALAAGTLKHPAITRALGSAILSAYIKIPNIGCRSAVLGNACILALSDNPTHDALIQLDLARNKVKYLQAQKLLYKAFNDAASAMGISQDQLADMIVPTYGLTLSSDASASRPYDLGPFKCLFQLSKQGEITTSWLLPDGKTQSAPPKQAKSDHPADLKEITKAAKEAQNVLSIQKNRLESTFLTNRSWLFQDWQKNIAAHPLVSSLARRLIWISQTPNKSVNVFAISPENLLNFVDSSDAPFSPQPDATIRLWHPLLDTPQNVIAWRNWIQSHQIVQPIKQAHREVYVLTDAERTTHTHSNRFAAHILRQHQFKALCDARGWGFDLHISHADTGAGNALKPLTAHGLVAEYFVQPAAGAGVTGPGVALHLATDQVRFYNAADMATPLPLDSVDPLVFSEVLRDLDLFTSVASVANDPNWSDSGELAQRPDHVTYWQHYSFGDLTATAQSRKDLLQTIIPRLKIAPLCSFSDKWLHVQGKLNAYKIHLGSGNIQIEPANRYLCIVPSPAHAKSASSIYLPFEGDSTLSIILSKAFLLAADDKITDPTITRQLQS
jgi:hypothetical protein